MSKAKAAGAAAAGLLAVGSLGWNAADALTQKWEGEGVVEAGYRIGYWDPLGKVATACNGHTKTAVVGNRYTKAQCDELRRQDLEEAARWVRSCVPASTPWQAQGAYLDLTLNIGGPKFCKSTAARQANAGNWRASCDAILMWNKVCDLTGCRVIRGLANRRDDERKLCLQGVS